MCLREPNQIELALPPHFSPIAHFLLPILYLEQAVVNRNCFTKIKLALITDVSGGSYIYELIAKRKLTSSCFRRLALPGHEYVAIIFQKIYFYVVYFVVIASKIRAVGLRVQMLYGTLLVPTSVVVV